MDAVAHNFKQSKPGQPHQPRQRIRAQRTAQGVQQSLAPLWRKPSHIQQNSTREVTQPDLPRNFRQRRFIETRQAVAGASAIHVQSGQRPRCLDMQNAATRQRCCTFGQRGKFPFQNLIEDRAMRKHHAILKRATQPRPKAAP